MIKNLDLAKSLLAIIQSKEMFKNLRDYITLNCPEITITDENMQNMQSAKLILGNDFISPEDLMVAFNFSYTEEQLVNFITTLPDKETLQWLRTNGYMLIPGPVNDANLLEVQNFDLPFTYRMINLLNWWQEEDQLFPHDDKVSGGKWLILKKSGVFGSTPKNWYEQEQLVKDHERIPNVTEVVYGIIVYGHARHTYLPNYHARTDSVDSCGYHIVVWLNEQRVMINNKWNNTCRAYDLGVASAFKL